MTREQYEVYPDVLAVLAVREVKGEKRVLVTTMLDSRKTRKKYLLELYAQRWQVELDFRNIKTTLGMELLRCLTPQMVEKEPWVNLPAYNLIRLLMATMSSSKIDVIGSVSGGSFTSAYYGLYGEGTFDDFEGRFLERNVQ